MTDHLSEHMVANQPRGRGLEVRTQVLQNKANIALKAGDKPSYDKLVAEVRESLTPDANARMQKAMHAGLAATQNVTGPARRNECGMDHVGPEWRQASGIDPVGPERRQACGIDHIGPARR